MNNSLYIQFWATVCKTVRHMPSDRCLSVCLSVTLGVLWPNGWMDQDTTWYGGRPRRRRDCVRWGPSSPTERGRAAPIFGSCLLWPNGWIDQDTMHLVYGGRPRRRPDCVRWGPSSPTERGTAAHPPLFVPLCSGTAAHLSNC